VDHHTVETKTADIRRSLEDMPEDTKNPSLEPLQREASEILRGKDVMQEHMAREANARRAQAADTDAAQHECPMENANSSPQIGRPGAERKCNMPVVCPLDM